MNQPRPIVLSGNGRWLAVRRSDRVDLLDLRGVAPARAMPAPDGDLAFVGGELWMLDQQALQRVSCDTLLDGGAPVPLPSPRRLVPLIGAAGAIAAGSPTVRISVRGDAVVLDPLDGLEGGEEVIAAAGTRAFAIVPHRLRALDRGRGEVWRRDDFGFGDRPRQGDAALLFGGRALALLDRGKDGSATLSTLRVGGELIHRVTLDSSDVGACAIAPASGHAFVAAAGGRELHRVDLRYGRVLGTITSPVAIEGIAVDDDGQQLVLLGEAGELVEVLAAELFRAGAEPPADEPDEPAADERPIEVRAEPVADAAEGETLGAPPPRPEPPLPRVLPLALGAPAPAPPPPADGTSPYPTARAHLDALLDVVTARAALAIAEAWNSGRLSSKDSTRRPHELEVSALLGTGGSFAPDRLAEMRARVEQKQKEAAERARASAAARIRLPFTDLVRELGLSATAAQILLVVAAPAIRGEIARLYGVLGNDAGRPLVDRHLVEQMIAGEESVLRDQIARELARDAPLCRHGVIHVEATVGPSLFARLSAPDTLLDRMRGLRLPRADEIATVRGADTSLEALVVPDPVKRAILAALADPRPAHAPARVVVRGRRGSGRRALLAALAARVDREIAAIDLSHLAHAPRDLAAALEAALFRARIHGVVPVVSGLEQVDPVDAEARELVRHVVRRHPGPVAFRTQPEGTLPLDPGFVTVTLPPLTETERVGLWDRAAAEAGLACDAALLAARYRVGPGVIREVIAAVAARPADGEDATTVLDEQIRQHVATRLEHVSSRITRRAGWADVALPEEMLDSLREFIGRARHRRTVYDTWGYDQKMTTSRGLTALFYGPPGTGKTMVAGVIATELGLDMYRVDLARVVSKWVGETEKNLAEVFDAAEDGQVLVLFDEADSLFAKRTDVRTSNDRYANLEVNYLLQRLDTFDGVAILTSNLDGTIDPAFKRRLSMRLQFPFPDEEMRVRLWSAHITPTTPTAGDFDFVDLAHRFPLSGGYIRNCAVRAAFIAAHEGRPLGQEHLLRAIQLEYRELGKLSTSSRME